MALLFGVEDIKRITAGPLAIRVYPTRREEIAAHLEDLQTLRAKYPPTESYRGHAVYFSFLSEVDAAIARATEELQRLES